MMDLSTTHEIKDDLRTSNNTEMFGTSECISSTANQYSNSSFIKSEYEGNDYALQPQKTEKVISAEIGGSAFLSGCLTQSKRQFSRNGSLSSKKAMDLSLHVDRGDRSKTIFDDADYFARNYLYKLLPITFESVNETIIHIEHNYCHFVSSSEVDADENLNTTLRVDVEERNYKKWKVKVSSDENNLSSSDHERGEDQFVEDFKDHNENMETVASNMKSEGDIPVQAVQPLDLSLPLVQEQKTDNLLKENQQNIPKVKTEAKTSPEVKQINVNESNKENVTTPSRKIEVTISRPGQKEFYQPGEVFLNDVARISPDLVKNDCYEIDIIDRTHGEEVEGEMCRTYYIVSEPTWRLFENSNERIILTNDLNIGQPIQQTEKFEKPTYLIFDQYSLTESLAKICEKKGGSFQYTCLEESKELISKLNDDRWETQAKDCDYDGAGGEFSVSKVTLEREKCPAVVESWKSGGGGQKQEEKEGEEKLKSEMRPGYLDGGTIILEKYLTRGIQNRKEERTSCASEVADNKREKEASGKNDEDVGVAVSEEAKDFQGSQSERLQTEDGAGHGSGAGVAVLPPGIEPEPDVPEDEVDVDETMPLQDEKVPDVNLVENELKSDDENSECLGGGETAPKMELPREIEAESTVEADATPAGTETPEGGEINGAISNGKGRERESSKRKRSSSKKKEKDKSELVQLQDSSVRSVPPKKRKLNNGYQGNEVDDRGGGMDRSDGKGKEKKLEADDGVAQVNVSPRRTRSGSYLLMCSKKSNETVKEKADVKKGKEELSEAVTGVRTRRSSVIRSSAEKEKEKEKEGVKESEVEVRHLRSRAKAEASPPPVITPRVTRSGKMAASSVANASRNGMKEDEPKKKEERQSKSKKDEGKGSEVRVKAPAKKEESSKGVGTAKKTAKDVGKSAKVTKKEVEVNGVTLRSRTKALQVENNKEKAKKNSSSSGTKKRKR